MKSFIVLQLVVMAALFAFFIQVQATPTEQADVLAAEPTPTPALTLSAPLSTGDVNYARQLVELKIAAPLRSRLSIQPMMKTFSRVAPSWREESKYDPIIAYEIVALDDAYSGEVSVHFRLTGRTVCRYHVELETGNVMVIDQGQEMTADQWIATLVARVRESGMA
ncbi:MAG: hypothetical protein AAF432_01510 [Planctomycetota bacterium]